MAGCRVYICDDSPEYRLLLRMVLADEGAVVVGEGGDGNQCLEQAAATDPSMVFLDLNMPGLTGLEALPKLREALPDAKIVVLTTSRAIESERAAMAAGADAYVPKPIDATSVPRLVREKLAAQLFDHVGIAASDLAASERFYRTVLGALGVEVFRATAELVEWEDWDVGPTDGEHALTRGLHVAFRARDRAQADAFWQAGVDAGYRDDGGFLLDPDGNSVEAVLGDADDGLPVGSIDHLWIRVSDLQASRRFYTTIAPYAGLRLERDDPARMTLAGPDFRLSLVRDERPLTEHVHIAFSAPEDSTVQAFHAAALAAGYEDNGAPGERLAYHPGYYGAFVLDPDGHNVEVVNHNRG